MQWSWLLLCRNAQWRQQNTEIQPQKKSLGVPFIIYADLECLLEKMHSCQNNREKSYTEKKLSIRLAAIHCLKIAHLMQQKTNLVVTEGKTYGKVFQRFKGACNENN